MSLKKLFILLFGIQFTLIIGLGMMTLRLFRNEEALTKSRDVRFQSWILADELRQSSDDLTRMARTYVATGNPEYERQYWEVLNIRNGKSPRPVNYNQIYWDLVTTPGQKPREDGMAISLHELMISEGFTAAEFDKLTEAQNNSDELVNVERIAMNAVKGLFADRNGNFTVKKKPDRELAIRLMNDEAYHKTKARIMRPINDFYVMFIQRTTNNVLTNERHSKNLLSGIIVLIFTIIGILVFSFVMIINQIGRREKAEYEIIRKNEQLQLANAEKDKFFSIIAHDLRSPFNSLLGFTRMMTDEMPSLTLEEIRKIAVSMRKSTTNLYNLLENLLEWSRMQRDLINPSPESILLRHEIAENLELIKESAGRKKITIAYEIPAELEVYADKSMLGAIIRNLASNAIKFTHQNGKVSFVAESQPDDSVTISVSDTGIGMNKEMIRNLFRLDSKTNRKGTDREPTTGLGLIICREFIEKHGGKLWIESEEGKGSKFIFSLPSASR